MVSKLKRKNKFIKRICKIPQFVAWIFPRRIWFGLHPSSVYLTFDDGPHSEITPWLLAELKQHNIKATFFWNGNRIEDYPELLTQAIEEGHVVGHHGYFHQSAKTLSYEAFKENYNRSKTIVNSQLFRPPHGVLTRKQARFALKNGEVVMWSWMSYDFDENFPISKILEKEIGRAH